jgi:hypothetical protein
LEAPPRKSLNPKKRPIRDDSSNETLRRENNEGGCLK